MTPPVLVFTDGPIAGRRIEVVEELVVGREDASLTIEDEEISRRHAVVRPTEGGIEVEDLGSTNGTYVNAVRIDQATRLAGGDTVKLGRSVLQVESRAAATVAARVPATVAAATPVATPVAAAATPARTAPAAAFGAYAAPAAKRTRGIASRQLGPQLVSFAIIIATAIALVLYFADR